MQGVLGTLLHHGTFAFAFVMVAVLAVAEETRHRLGSWRATRREFRDQEASTIGAITADILTLLTLALGLSVSIPIERFNTRRDIVIQEANAIGGRVAAQVAKLLGLTPRYGWITRPSVGIGRPSAPCSTTPGP